MNRDVKRIADEIKDGRRHAFIAVIQNAIRQLVIGDAPRMISQAQYCDPSTRSGLINRLEVRSFDHEQANLITGGIPCPSRIAGLRGLMVTAPPCKNGVLCTGMNIPIAGFNPTSQNPLESGTILRAYMSPSELDHFERTGVAPADAGARCCVLCDRMVRHLFMDVLSVTRSGRPRRWLLQTHMSCEGEVQSDGSFVNEYATEHLYFPSDQDFNGLVAPVARLSVNALVASQVEGCPKGVYIISQRLMRHDPTRAAASSNASRSDF